MSLALNLLILCAMAAAVLLLVGAGLVTWRKRQRDELGRFSA